MHRARQGAGAVRAQTGTGGSRLRLRVPAAGAGLLVLGMRRGDPTTTPAAAARRGAAHKASPVSTVAREAGSGIELRGLPWSCPWTGQRQRTTVSTQLAPTHPAPATRVPERRGESRGRRVEVRPSRPTGPRRGSRLRFRSAVCVSTAVTGSADRPAVTRADRPGRRATADRAERRAEEPGIAGPPSDYRFIADR